MSDVRKELRYGKYGTNALKIYDECCNTFGWKNTDRYYFMPRNQLYAKNSAGDLSVWFIANSDWVEKFDEKHKNILGFDADQIIEEYLQGEMPSETDKTDRIVFAKKKNNEYYFIGVYRILNNNKNIRTYVRYKNYYPFGKLED